MHKIVADDYIATVSLIFFVKRKTGGGHRWLRVTLSRIAKNLGCRPPPLSGLTTLSDEAAEYLSGHKEDLFFMDQDIVSRMERLRKKKPAKKKPAKKKANKKR